jgi:hypothetical protein
MNYITHHDYTGNSLSGIVSFHRGDILNLVDNMLYHNGHQICVARSYNGKKHFARNDDGNGLERGDITHAIAYGERGKKGGRFTPEEIAMIERDYPQFDHTANGVLLFSDEFFTADIETLRELAGKLDISV